MAYNFARASSQYLTATLGTAVEAPMTLFAHFKTSNLTDALVVLSTNTEATSGVGNPRQQIVLDGSNDTARAASVSDSGVEAISTTTYGTSAANVLALYSATTSRAIFLNGEGKGTNAQATGGAQIPLSRIGLGARYSTAWGAFMDGDISEAAIWSVALTDAEVNSLGKGFSPRRIRPQSLIFYAPMIRTLQDIKNGITLTNNNSATVANHPRVYA